MVGIFLIALYEHRVIRSSTVLAKDQRPIRMNGQSWTRWDSCARFENQNQCGPPLRNSTPALLRLPTPFSVPRTSVADASLVQSSSSLRPPLSLTLLLLSLSFSLYLRFTYSLTLYYPHSTIRLLCFSLAFSSPHSLTPPLSFSIFLFCFFLTYSLTYSFSRIYTYAGTLYNIHAVCPLLIRVPACCVVYLPRV